VKVLYAEKALSRKTAVITGASGGVGKAIALSFAREGASLCLVGRDLKVLEEIAENTRSSAARVRIHQADFDVDRDITTLAERILRDFEEVDLLVHSAGVISLGNVESAPVRDLDRQYSVNVRGPYILTQGLLPVLSTCQGQIVFINSSLALKTRGNLAQYAATKHALKAMADGLRDEVNPKGVRVVSLFLGRTATAMQAAVHQIEGKTYKPSQLLQPEEVAAAVLLAVSLPKTAEITDIHMRPMIPPC
jgi:NADP-dependent 3-hydroxy acid dehydrogenase YdfG